MRSRCVESNLIVMFEALDFSSAAGTIARLSIIGDSHRSEVVRKVQSMKE